MCDCLLIGIGSGSSGIMFFFSVSNMLGLGPRVQHIPATILDLICPLFGSDFVPVNVLLLATTAAAGAGRRTGLFIVSKELKMVCYVIPLK